MPTEILPRLKQDEVSKDAQISGLSSRVQELELQNSNLQEALQTVVGQNELLMKGNSNQSTITADEQKIKDSEFNKLDLNKLQDVMGNMYTQNVLLIKAAQNPALLTEEEKTYYKQLVGTEAYQITDEEMKLRQNAIEERQKQMTTVLQQLATENQQLRNSTALLIKGASNANSLTPQEMTSYEQLTGVGARQTPIESSGKPLPSAEPQLNNAQMNQLTGRLNQLEGMLTNVSKQNQALYSQNELLTKALYNPSGLTPMDRENYMSMTGISLPDRSVPTVEYKTLPVPQYIEKPAEAKPVIISGSKTGFQRWLENILPGNKGFLPWVGGLAAGVLETFGLMALLGPGAALLKTGVNALVIDHINQKTQEDRKSERREGSGLLAGLSASTLALAMLSLTGNLVEKPLFEDFMGRIDNFVDDALNLNPFDDDDNNYNNSPNNDEIDIDPDKNYGRLSGEYGRWTHTVDGNDTISGILDEYDIPVTLGNIKEVVLDNAYTLARYNSVDGRENYNTTDSIERVISGDYSDQDIWDAAHWIWTGEELIIDL